MPCLQAPPSLLRAQEGELLIGFRSESLLASERPHLFGVRLFRLRTRWAHRMFPPPHAAARLPRPYESSDKNGRWSIGGRFRKRERAGRLFVSSHDSLHGEFNRTSLIYIPLCTAIKLLGKQTVFPRKDFISSFICHREQPTINIQRFSNRIFRYISKNYRLLSKSKQANCTASSRAKINRLFSAS